MNKNNFCARLGVAHMGGGDGTCWARTKVTGKHGKPPLTRADRQHMARSRIWARARQIASELKFQQHLSPMWR